jgi:hypothetical protein
MAILLHQFWQQPLRQLARTVLQRRFGRDMFRQIHGHARLPVHGNDFPAGYLARLDFNPGAAALQVALAHSDFAECLAGDFNGRAVGGSVIRQREAALLQNQRQLGLCRRVNDDLAKMLLGDFYGNNRLFLVAQRLLDFLNIWLSGDIYKAVEN